MLGAIIGDVVGSIYEFDNIRTKNFDFITQECTFTDDTIMTVAIANALMNDLDVEKEVKRMGLKYPSSYGISFSSWLKGYIKGPYNSFGNGSAMRVSPCGWLGNNEEKVKALSKKVTEITHNHPEGIKGAEVVAMCIYYARKGYSKEFIKNYAEKYYKLDFTYEELVKNYSFNETCQESVPQAIYCFLISNDFEDAIRTVISIGGDSDTIAAITGSIAEAFYKKIDESVVKEILTKLPDDMKTVLKQFYELKKNELSEIAMLLEKWI